MSIRPIAAILIPALLAAGAAGSAEIDVTGTWKLVSSTRKIVATGQTLDSYGPRPTGWLIYGPEGRMTYLLVYADRPRPRSIEAWRS